MATSKCNKTSECECFNDSTRNMAIATSFGSMLDSMIKPEDPLKPETPSVLNACQVAYNNYSVKLYFTTISIIDSQCMCIKNTDQLNKQAINIETYSQQLAAQNVLETC
jgi:hypothetical protein